MWVFIDVFPISRNTMARIDVPIIHPGSLSGRGQAQRPGCRKRSQTPDSKLTPHWKLESRMASGDSTASNHLFRTPAVNLLWLPTLVKLYSSKYRRVGLSICNSLVVRSQDPASSPRAVENSHIPSSFCVVWGSFVNGNEVDRGCRTRITSRFC